MKISISYNAHNNISSITKYSSQISFNYANRIVNNIYSTLESLRDSPYIGRYVPELSTKHYRELICDNYRIIYFVSEKHNTIFIRYIISGKQNSNLFFEIHKKELFNSLNRFFN